MRVLDTAGHDDRPCDSLLGCTMADDTNNPGAAPTAQASPKIAFHPSDGFPAWLAERGGALAFTTGESGKLFLVGCQPEGKLAISERSFARCTALAATERTLWMASDFQLWRLENALGPKVEHRGHDRLFVPRVGYTTGGIGVRDIGIGDDGRPVLVNGLFSCLASASDTHSFSSIWRPAFVSALAPEDRCHMSGLAMAAGAPGYVAAAAESDKAGGWQGKQAEGGIIIDVTSNQIVARGLSLPHAPRLFGGALWVLNSGTGEIGRCDLKSGRFEAVAFCPGYLRGLTLVDRFAVVGLGLPRSAQGYGGLPLDDRLARHKAAPSCGLMVVDLKAGRIVQSLMIRGLVREVHGVAFLSGAKRPMALGFKTDEIRQVLTVQAEDQR